MIGLMLEIAFNGLEDAELDEEKDEGGVSKGDCDVAQEIAEGIFAVLLGEHFLATFVHEDETEDIGEPVADNERGFEGAFVNEADNPGEGEGDGDIDEKIVPPGQR